MKKNMGSTDKIIRVILALIIFTLYFTGIIPGLLGIILSAIAIIFVLTSLVGTCPLYLPFGIGTLRNKIG